ncbi:hypothetical protein HDU98_003928 [Podochytrium sp. JEL0797]|nr:hypothetical protein HDU98_003928 [Podochytrium sp. JEL0797]
MPPPAHNLPIAPHPRPESMTRDEVREYDAYLKAFWECVGMRAPWPFPPWFCVKRRVEERRNSGPPPPLPIPGPVVPYSGAESQHTRVQHVQHHSNHHPLPIQHVSNHHTSSNENRNGSIPQPDVAQARHGFSDRRYSSQAVDVPSRDRGRSNAELGHTADTVKAVPPLAAAGQRVRGSSQHRDSSHDEASGRRDAAAVNVVPPPAAIQPRHRYSSQAVEGHHRDSLHVGSERRGSIVELGHDAAVKVDTPPAMGQPRRGSSDHRYPSQVVDALTHAVAANAVPPPASQPIHGSSERWDSSQAVHVSPRERGRSNAELGHAVAVKAVPPSSIRGASERRDMSHVENGRHGSIVESRHAAGSSDHRYSSCAVEVPQRRERDRSDVESGHAAAGKVVPPPTASQPRHRSSERRDLSQVENWRHGSIVESGHDAAVQRTDSRRDSGGHSHRPANSSSNRHDTIKSVDATVSVPVVETQPLHHPSVANTSPLPPPRASTAPSTTLRRASVPPPPPPPPPPQPTTLPTVVSPSAPLAAVVIPDPPRSIVAPESDVTTAQQQKRRRVRVEEEEDEVDYGGSEDDSDHEQAVERVQLPSPKQQQPLVLTAAPAVVKQSVDESPKHAVVVVNAFVCETRRRVVVDEMEDEVDYGDGGNSGGEEDEEMGGVEVQVVQPILEESSALAAVTALMQDVDDEMGSVKTHVQPKVEELFAPAAAAMTEENVLPMEVDVVVEACGLETAVGASSVCSAWVNPFGGSAEDEDEVDYGDGDDDEYKWRVRIVFVRFESTQASEIISRRNNKATMFLQLVSLRRKYTFRRFLVFICCAAVIPVILHKTLGFFGFELLVIPGNIDSSLAAQPVLENVYAANDVSVSLVDVEEQDVLSLPTVDLVPEMNDEEKPEQEPMQQSLSLEKQIPEDFTFWPTPAERPLKSKVILTFLASASNEDWKLLPLRDADWFFVGSYLHAFTFLHRPETRLKPEDDTEFAVMVTPLVPQAYIDGLLDLGARVILVPSIEIPGREKPGDKYQYLYTKLNMYRLEGIYSAVLFLDVDINYFHKSPVTLFNHVSPKIDATSPTHPYFFASTREWQDGNGIFNTGVQLMIPSNYHYEQLLTLAKDPNKTKYGDQGLLNVYFGAKGDLKASGDRAWMELPRLWNVNHLEARTREEMETAAGVHGKLWSECRFLNADSAPIFGEWQKAMTQLRGVQAKMMKEGKSRVGAVVVPSVPETCEEWQEVFGATTKRWQTAFNTVAMVSFDSAPVEALRSRDLFAGRQEQAVHLVVPKGSMVALLQQLKDDLLTRYDFVWVLTDSIVMSDRPGLFWMDLKEMRKRGGVGDIIFAFRDCQHNLSGSFLIASQGKTKLDQFFLEMDKNSHNKQDDALVWEMFLSAFTRKGGRNCLQIEGRSVFYEFPKEECLSFYPLREFGRFSPDPLGTVKESVETVNPDYAMTFDSKSVIPPEFKFIPSLESQPPKSKAIITLLAIATPDYKTKPFADSDWFWSGAYLFAYTFMHNPKTKLDPNLDVESVVLVTPGVPTPYINALLSFGVRVLIVPALEIPGREKPGDKYQYVYTKLQMQRLEAIYKGVLYVDVDLYYFNESPVVLFDTLDAHRTAASAAGSSVSPLFFGSTAEWKQHEKKWGQFNSGLQMFTPSNRQFERLFEYTKDPEYARYGDQGLLTTYFEDKWVELPQRYNTHHLEERNATSMNEAVGFHHKYWCDCHLMTEASKTSFGLWVRDVRAIRRFQLEKMESSDESLWDVPVMPIVSEDCEEWKDLVGVALKAKVLLDTVAALSVGEEDVEVLKSRDSFARQYEQANHVVKEAMGMLERLEFVSGTMLAKYDWVWMVGSGVSLQTSKRPFSFELAQFKDHPKQVELVVFGDCANGGSVLFSKHAITRVAEFIKRTRSAGTAASDADIWKAMMNEFDATLFVKKLDDGQKLGLYSLKDGKCSV